MPRILIMDDDWELRNTLRRILEFEGYEVEDVPNGNVGIDSLHRRPADLAVIDIVMPGKDGLETIKTVREEFPEVKIVAMSGGGFFTPDNFLRSARLHGADHVLAKPFEQEELVVAIKRLLS